MTTIQVITIIGACCVTLLCAYWLTKRANADALEQHGEIEEHTTPDQIIGGPL